MVPEGGPAADALGRMAALVEGLRAIDASALRDLDAVLDEIASQTRRLLGADHAGVQLRVPGTDEFVRRRRSPLAEPQDTVLRAGLRFRPDALAQEAFATGRAVFALDFPRDQRIEAGVRAALPTVASSVAVPMLVEGEAVGFMFAHWEQPYRERPGDAETMRLLAQHAALVVRLSEALDDARRAHAEAEAAVGVRDEFLSVAAHELRTPIAALRGFAQLLGRQLDRPEADPARVRTAARQIDEQSRRVTTLVERLLDLARIQGGRLALDTRETDLVGLIGGLVERLRGIYDAHPIVFEAPAALAAVVDPLRLEQVVANLVDNAAKFSPEGAPIDVELRAGGGEAVIAVRDHGIGIPAERRGEVFQRFVQVHGARHYGGLGVGLYVSQQIADLHGGRIEVEAPDGGGTRVVVHLPLGGPAEGGTSVGRS